ncbi:hypothetical protein ACFSVK_05195 [Azorhizophilus paspali]|uniref:hypothetical protein n=1 Tax=Azorhizophilus paspali TaxID=69963 RepID=UPI003630DBF2
MLKTDQVPASLWLNSKVSDEYFKDKKKFYFFAVLVVFLVSCSSFLNVWVYTQWLFSYEFGLIKRGLPGELLRQLNVTHL